MASRFESKIKKLEQKLRIGDPGQLVVIVPYGESQEYAIAKAKEAHSKDVNFIFVIDYANALPSIEEQIEQEKKLIEELSTRAAGKASTV
jgi:hypothetical protein